MTRPAMLTVKEIAALKKCSIELVYKRLKLRAIPGAVWSAERRCNLIPASWKYVPKRAGNPNWRKAQEK